MYLCHTVCEQDTHWPKVLCLHYTYVVSGVGFIVCSVIRLAYVTHTHTHTHRHTYTQTQAHVIIDRAFLCCVFMSSQLHSVLVFQAYLSLLIVFLSPFCSLAGGSKELAMHFTLNSEYVAMVVARDLA